ncbi:Uncharacterized protein TCM_015556 [Theobroma cacao]|uniref:Uncharacterized protein n=1 Tax=Theobroma cacao TaxID=3641 RepID=A0A061G2Z4_THECC|nr:Uncharacterized protein TCM_015556 [Theobroma cacao]
MSGMSGTHLEVGSSSLDNCIVISSGEVPATPVSYGAQSKSVFELLIVPMLILLNLRECLSAVPLCCWHSMCTSNLLTSNQIA